MDFSKFTAALQRCHEVLDRWFALQDTQSKLLSNAGNILQRLPVLHESRYYAGLLPNVQQLVLAKQVRALEAVFGRLQANLSDMEGTVRSLERLVVEMWRLLGDSPGAPACAVVQPGGASVSQLVECVEDLWRLCRDDLAVRAATLAHLSHTTTPQQFAELSAALLECTGVTPGIDPVVLLRSVAPALK